MKDTLVEIDLIAALPSAKMQTISVPDIPRPLAHYTPATRVGELVFAAGQIASDYKTGVPREARVDPAFPFYDSDVKRQTRYVLENLAKTFKAAGTSLDQVVKAQVFHLDLANFAGFDEAWREFFPAPPPRTSVGTTGLWCPAPSSRSISSRPRPERAAGAPRPQRPLNDGARFSTNARMPSRASSVSKQTFWANVSNSSAPRGSVSSVVVERALGQPDGDRRARGDLARQLVAPRASALPARRRRSRCRAAALPARR